MQLQAGVELIKMPSLVVDNSLQLACKHLILGAQHCSYAI